MGDAMRRLGLSAGMMLCVVGHAASILAQSQADRLLHFEKLVRPVLVEHCQKCHGEEKQRGGLRVDGLEHLLKGGDSGPAVAPGDVAASLLLRAISYEHELRMPPQGKLPDADRAVLVAWVQSGLPWPEAPSEATPTASIAKEIDRPWSFLSIATPELPVVSRTDWVRNDIDRFVLARLEAAGLSPAPEADRQTWIRRATYDLWGLPPTPEEVEAFVADTSDDACERVIDRLLASPRYGERWGRHWLDVARYADSNGLDENLAYVNAFRYRDYVVDAWNADKPYDQFVREQLAGDLLPSEGDEVLRQERLVATGFLALGAKMLAEDDPVKMEMDIIDEQVDAIGTAFLGLTLGCARCHDHKFDPISTADYYALAGIFKSTRTMDNFSVVAKWHERPLATAEVVSSAEAYQAVVERKRQQIATVETAGAGASREELARLKGELSELEQAAPAPLPYAMAVEEGTATDLPIHRRGSHLNLGEVVSRGFPRALAGESPVALQGSGRRELADWITRPEHPLTARVIVNRVWRWHFGAGLVRSTDNFGNLGERPSHPELLDWLASHFVMRGWSLKSLHRLIMSSATYRMSSAYDAHAAAVDPDDRLLWQWRRKRLEAEAIRDAMLFVAGNLDETRGGSLLTSNPREYVTGTASRNATTYASQRRSLYLPVIRSALYELFQAFDFAEPSVAHGDRDATTMAPQALFMLNAELVHQQAQSLAEQLIVAHPDDASERIVELYERALSRAPTPAEADRALRFVENYAAHPAVASLDGDAQFAAWRALCRVMLASNEFLYVD